MSQEDVFRIFQVILLKSADDPKGSRGRFESRGRFQDIPVFEIQRVSLVRVMSKKGPKPQITKVRRLRVSTSEPKA